MESISGQFLPGFKSLLESYHLTQEELVKLKERSTQIDHNNLVEHVSNLLPSRFPATIPFVQWNNLKRYLKAVRIRLDRLMQNPEKDLEKSMFSTPGLKSCLNLKKKN